MPIEFIQNITDFFFLFVSEFLPLAAPGGGRGGGSGNWLCIRVCLSNHHVYKCQFNCRRRYPC